MFNAAAVEKVGTVKAFGGSSAPDGWLFCDGSAISRTTYAALFAVIGTTYGVGDGTTTFNLPNLWVLGQTAPVSVHGNGKTLGITDGTNNGGLGANASAVMFAAIGQYNLDVGSAVQNTLMGMAKTMGVVTSGESGLIGSARLGESSQIARAIIKY